MKEQNAENPLGLLENVSLIGLGRVLEKESRKPRRTDVSL